MATPPFKTALKPDAATSPQSAPIDAGLQAPASPAPDAAPAAPTPFDLPPDLISKIFGESFAPGASVKLKLGENNQVTAEPCESEGMTSEVGPAEEAGLREQEPDDGVPESFAGSPKNASTKVPEGDLPPVDMKELTDY